MGLVAVLAGLGVVAAIGTGGGAGNSAEVRSSAPVGVGVSVVGFPGVESTGPASLGFGALSRYDGPHTITKPGTVISGKIITAPLWVKAANVTIRGSVIEGPTDASTDTPALRVEGDRAVIEGNIIRGNSADDLNQSPATGVWLYSDDTTFRGNNMYWVSGDGITIDGNNVTVADNYVHDFIFRDGVHFDAIVIDASTTHTIAIRHNTVDMWLSGGMSGVIGIPISGPNISVVDNLLAGGGYTIEGGGAGIDGGAGVTITGNRFSTRHSAKCGIWGPYSHLVHDGSIIWSNNAFYTNNTTETQIALH